MHLAAQYGHTEVADILLKAGASRDTRTKVDRTPLHIASLEGHLPIVNLLISNGAEIDAKDLLKMTPLHWAVERGHFDVVELLLASGADVNLQSKFDKTPIDIAYDVGRRDMIPLLEKHVNSYRPKSNQVLAIQNVKQRPTILPNKSNRNQKLVKTPSNTSNLNLNDNSISSTNNKSFTIESFKKIMNDSASSTNSKKSLNSSLSTNKITTRSSVNNQSGTNNQLNVTGDFKEAIQWIEKSLNKTATSTTTNGKDNEQTLSQSNSSSTNTPNKAKNNNVITIALNNQNFNQLIKNSQSAPFVIINSNDLDDKKKVIKLNPTAKANNVKSTNYSTVDSDQDDEVMPTDRLKQEMQSIKNENKLLKDEMKTMKSELASLKKDMEKKDKIIEDFRKRFN